MVDRSSDEYVRSRVAPFTQHASLSAPNTLELGRYVQGVVVGWHLFILPHRSAPMWLKCRIVRPSPSGERGHLSAYAPLGAQQPPVGMSPGDSHYGEDQRNED